MVAVGAAYVISHGLQAALSGWWPRSDHRRSLGGKPTSLKPHCGFRFSAEVIQHAVQLYHCYILSLQPCCMDRGCGRSYPSPARGSGDAEGDRASQFHMWRVLTKGSSELFGIGGEVCGVLQVVQQSQ